MAYTKAGEEQKWKQWKEKMLRTLGGRKDILKKNAFIAQQKI